MSNKTYDIIKIITLIIYPAVTTFVGVTLETLSVNGSGIVMTIMTAFGTMLGTIIEKISADYKKKVSE